jgi:hypothetical protein
MPKGKGSYKGTKVSSTSIVRPGSKKGRAGVASSQPQRRATTPSPLTGRKKKG